MKRTPVLDYAIVVLLVLCVLVVFWPSADPSRRYKSMTTYHVTQDQMIPVEQAIAEADRILEKARQLSENGGLTIKNMFALQKRMRRLTVYAEQNGPNPRLGKIFYSGLLESRLASIRDNDKQFRSISSKEFERYRNFFNTDHEWLELKAFRVSTTTNNWPIVAGHRTQRYLTTIPLGIVVCVLLILKNGVPLGYALVKAFNHPFWMALYPFGIVWTFGISYVSVRQYRQEIKRLVSWMNYVTAASVTLFCGGTASAQTPKKDDKKKNPSYTLQLDTRVIASIEGPPLSLFNRTTLNASRWLIESISTMMPQTGGWYNEIGVGTKIVKTPQTIVSGLGIVSTDSGGTQKVMLGAQYFRASPLSVIAVPIARVEKTIDGPIAVAAAANPFFRLGREGTLSRLALSPDVFVRKTFGKPLAWAVGLGLDFFTRKGKGDRVEAALLRNSSNQWQVRGRCIFNFAF